MEYNAKKEPTLEEYDLNIDSYLKYRKHLNNLISIRDSLSFTFWKYLLYIVIPILFILYFVLNVNIYTLVISAIIFLLFFENVKAYFNKINVSYQEISNEINNYSNKTQIGLFENKLLNHYIGYVDYYYRVYVFRKNIGRHEGKHLASLINETKNIARFFNSHYSGGYKEYLIKRFGVNPDIDYEENSNYFNFTKIIHSVNGIEKDKVSLIVNNEKTINQTKNNDFAKK